MFCAELLGVVLSCHAADDTAQPPKKLPRQPWHLADVWWTFENATPHFESLDLT